MFFFGKTYTDTTGKKQRLKPLDFQVLSLLQEKDGMTGYDIIKTLKERFKGLWVPSAGTIFPVLKRLNEDGLITKEETNVGDRSAVAHHITDEGQRALQGQITEDTDQELKFISDYLRQIFGSGPVPHRYIRVASFLDDLLGEARVEDVIPPGEDGLGPDVADKYTEIFNRILEKIQRFNPSAVCGCSHSEPDVPPAPYTRKYPPTKSPPTTREVSPKPVKGRPIRVEGDEESDGK